MNILDDNQNKIANCFDGAILVLAGPGSGKTTLLTERTLRLSIKTKKPHRILSVTFTNAAVLEMKERYVNRYENMTGYKCVNTPVFKTVHSLCNYILSEYEQYRGLRYTRITSECKKIEIIKGLEANINNGETYEEYKFKNNMIDFDDMIMYVNVILNSPKSEDVIFTKYIKSLFDYIQIDEAQDLTKEQFDVLEQICGSGNIFVVADDDQSIYGFRGAEPKNLFKFKDKYKTCIIFNMSRNYRSTQSIVKFSKRIISKNKERFEKNLFSLNEEGEKIKIMSFNNIVTQSIYVNNEIKKLKKHNSDMTFGVLFRNNYSAIIPKLILSLNNIKFKNEERGISTSDIVLIKKFVDEIRKEERKYIFVPSPHKSFLKMLENDFERKFYEKCKEIGKEGIYKDIIMLFFEFLCRNVISINDLIEILEKMDEGTNDSNISMSTIHSSKGLEFDAVFIIDMIKGVFPSDSIMDEQLLEEERRLFYVAVTRAKQRLYILYPNSSSNRYIKGVLYDKSIFVDESMRLLCENS